MTLTKSILIIICTAVREGEDEMVLRYLGIADYYRRTKDIEDLFAKTENVLKTGTHPTKLMGTGPI